MIRATPIMEIINWIYDSRIYFFLGKIIKTGELEVNNFFSFLAAMMLAYQPVRSLSTMNMVLSRLQQLKRIFE